MKGRLDKHAWSICNSIHWATVESMPKGVLYAWQQKLTVCFFTVATPFAEAVEFEGGSAVTC